MVLDKLSVPGRPIYLDNSTGLAVCAGGCCLDIFLASIFHFF